MASRTIVGTLSVALLGAALSYALIATSCNAPPFPSATSTICGYLQVQGAVIPAMTTNASAGCTLPSDAGEAGVVTLDGGAEAGAKDATIADSTGGRLTMEPAPPPNSVSGTATGIQFVATVTTGTPGQWQLTATASGALALPGAEGFSVGFSSSGAPVIIAIPLTIPGTPGLGSVEITVGDSTQDFLFAVEPATSPSLPTCIRSTDAGASLLSWVVEPAPPLVRVADGGATVLVDGGGVGTLIVDVRDLLFSCDDGGPAPLASASISIVGAGGLMPTLTPATSDPSGNVAYELRGPAVVDAATALLSIANGATTVVTVSRGTGH